MEVSWILEDWSTVTLWEPTGPCGWQVDSGSAACHRTRGTARTHPYSIFTLPSHSYFLFPCSTMLHRTLTIHNGWPWVRAYYFMSKLAIIHRYISLRDEECLSMQQGRALVRILFNTARCTFQGKLTQQQWGGLGVFTPTHKGTFVIYLIVQYTNENPSHLSHPAPHHERHDTVTCWRVGHLRSKCISVSSVKVRHWCWNPTRPAFFVAQKARVVARKRRTCKVHLLFLIKIVLTARHR